MFPKMKQSPVIVESEIGKRIKALRAEKNVTLEHLARQTGFTKGLSFQSRKIEKSPSRFHTRKHRTRVQNDYLSPLG